MLKICCEPLYVSNVTDFRKRYHFRNMVSSDGSNSIMYMEMPMFVRKIIVGVWVRNNLTVEQAMNTRLKDLEQLASYDILAGVHFSLVRFICLNDFCKMNGVHIRKHSEEADVMRTIKGSSFFDMWDNVD